MRVTPNDRVMAIDGFLSNLGGIARWRALADAGFSHAEMVEAVRHGRVVRPHRGVYALPGVTRPRVLAEVFRALPTCVSWCATRGLPLEKPPTTLHLAVPESRGLGHARRRPSNEVTLHRCGDVSDDFPLHHLDVTAMCTTPIQQVALLDAALGKGFIDGREVRLLTRGSQERRRWVASHVSGSAQSLGETYARVALRELGLKVEPQAHFEGAGAVDLLVEDSLVVEVDGFAFHSDQRSFAKDRQRSRVIAFSGLMTLRFTHSEVVADPGGMANEVVDVLWRQGHDPRKLRTAEVATRRLGEHPWWR